MPTRPLTAVAFLALSVTALGCGPIELTPVHHPVSCHCPRTIEVFRGQLEETSGGVARTRPVDLAVARSPENLELTLFDTSSERALCSISAELRGTWQNGPTCLDPIETADPAPITLVRGALTQREGQVELAFEAVAQTAGSERSIAGRFSGNAVGSSGSTPR